MELISREAVTDIIQKEMESVTDYLQHDVLINVEFEVYELPTVEAKEVVHGEWVDTQPDYHHGFGKNAHVCSNCQDYYTPDYEYMSFCPNCGADMRTSAE